jgi:hypothetical protein
MCVILARCANPEKPSTVKLPLAKMPEIGQHVRQRLESVMHFADVIESKQQALELVFPGKDAFDGLEALIKNSVVEDLLAASLGCLSTPQILIDIGRHSAIENGFPIQRAIVDAVQTDDAATQSKPPTLAIHVNCSNASRKRATHCGCPVLKE